MSQVTKPLNSANINRLVMQWWKGDGNYWKLPKARADSYQRLRTRAPMSWKNRPVLYGAVQAGSDGPPLSGTASSVVPRRLLCAGLHGSWSPASAIRQSPSTYRSMRPSQHFRCSCFRHCGPNSLEFSAWQFAWSSCWAW